MTSKWFKTPDGRLIRKQPTRLELFLRDNGPAFDSALDVAASVPLRQSAASYSREGDYSTDEFDNSMLAGREVTLFGAGSVGSYMGSFMAVGPVVLNVIDCKKVEYKHVQAGRTAYDSTHIGLWKVEALKRKIEAEHLGTTVRPFPFDVAELTTLDLRDMLERSLVVLLAIDDPVQILRVSDMAYPIVELVQAAMHTQGKSSHIGISMPLITPCLRCTLGISGPQDIHRLDGEPSDSLDIMNLAQQAARFAMAIAYSKVSGRQITRWDISKNLIYLSNSPDEFSPVGPGLHFEAGQKRPGCAICNPIMPC